MDITGAQDFSAGEVVELANLINDKAGLERRVKDLERLCGLRIVVEDFVMTSRADGFVPCPGTMQFDRHYKLAAGDVFYCYKKETK